jgi:hypothetical protein
MKRTWRFVLGGMGVLFAAGCGSGGGRSGGPGASLAMTIRWPARVAAPLPRNAQAIRVTLYRPASRTDEIPELLAGPKVVSRPENPDPGPARILFEGLSPGPVEAHVTAHGQRNAADSPCAWGVGSGEIQLGQRNLIVVEMQSLAARLEVQPASIQLASGVRQVLKVYAYDSTDTPILGLGFHWTSADPGIADVNPFTGELKAYSPGTTRITAREEFGTLSSAATVTVR